MGPLTGSWTQFQTWERGHPGPGLRNGRLGASLSNGRTLEPGLPPDPAPQKPLELVPRLILGRNWLSTWQSFKVLSPLPPDPCHSVTCRPQETCQNKNGQGVCVPNYQATCWLWGDPHYHSFDGWNFDFQGTCNYVLASTDCPGSNAQGLTPFTVTTKNENRGNPSVSYVRLVTVTTLNTNISIHKGEIGKVRVRLVPGPQVGWEGSCWS